MGIGSTISGIATYAAPKYVLPEGVSGNLIDTVDFQRIKVQNFTGQTIDPNAITEKFQDVIVDFSKADALEEAFSWAATVATSGGAVIIASGAGTADDLKLDDFQIKATASAETASLNYLTTLSKDTPMKLREQANKSLLNLGRKVSFSRSLS